MSSTTMFFVGIIVQVALAIFQVAVVVVFVYRWQRNSWRFGNIMKIREPLARAYCSLVAVVHAHKRLTGEMGDVTKTDHDKARITRYLSAAQDEILNFSVEHFKAKFWLTDAENRQLDVLFDKLREVWSAHRDSPEKPDIPLTELRHEILKFDSICGLMNYNGGRWSHVALEV